MTHTTPGKKLRLLHITDSHLDDKATVSTMDIKTHVDGITQPLRSSVLRDTVRNLAKSLTDSHQTLDAVVVSGDSTLKSDSGGQITLRNTLLELLADVGVTASNIIATPGNHDVISGSTPGKPERYELFVNAWLKPEPVIIPFLDGIHKIEKLESNSHVLVDPNKDWAIFPINSANWSQLQLTPENNPHVALLLDHLKKAADRNLDKALTKLLSYDIARISSDQLDALRQVVEEVGPIKLKIAVLHHHLLPVGNEEFKPFADITNLGPLRQVLRELGFNVILHGHKHTSTAYYDHIYSEDNPADPATRVLTISGGTFGFDGAHADSPLRIVEIDNLPFAATCTVKGISLAEAGRIPQFKDSPQYKLWENDSKNEGPAALFGKSIDDLYARAIRTVKSHPNRTIICTIDFDENDARAFPLAYPYKGDEAEKREWFKETVIWWQTSASRSESRMPYIHGSRLQRFGGGLDQIQRVIEIIKEGKPTSRALALVVDPARDFQGTKPFASFCLIQFCLKPTHNGHQLDCIGYYRAQEFNHWWPVNVAELQYLQSEVIKKASNTPGKISAGAITTISPYPRLSGDVRQPTKVAVPLIDQWLDNHPKRIAQIALAISQESDNLTSEDGINLWKRCLDDLEQATLVHHADGVPIAIEGLELLNDWISAATPSSVVIPLIEDLISANKAMPENPTRDRFDNWTTQVTKLLQKLRGVTPFLNGVVTPPEN